MSHTHHAIYLVLGPGRWGFTKLVAIRRRKPKQLPPTAVGVVQLNVAVPNNVFRPPECSVEIKPEHLRPDPITATSSKA